MRAGEHAMDAPTDAPSSSIRVPMFAIGGLVIASIAAVAAVRLSGMPISQPDAPVLMSRSLQFADRSDGAIDVLDARTHRVVDTVTGQAGFVRGTLRGLARERRRAGIGSTEPFDLIAHTDGRLTLVDPSTTRRVDLESFGPTNMAEFAQLLKSEQRLSAEGK